MANFFFFLLLGLLGHVQLSLQQDCSATQLCAIGCCSSSGFCGFGPDFCAKPGCLSGCDRKADCNPGTFGGSQWSKSDKCPLNVCCSKYGFCGTTADFCEGNPVKRPSCNVNNVPIERVIGYYESWSTSTRPCYNMLPEKIPYGYYTDIIFSFATINPQTFEIEAGDGKTSEYMERIRAIKLIQPDIRIWIAVGGWAFNDPGPTRTTFSDVAMSLANMNKFIDSLIKMMNRYGFDGVDIDWEYPVAEDRGGRGPDFKNFGTFMKLMNLRMKLANIFRPKLVSLTLPASYWYLQHFDIVELEKAVDWFNIMSYDMHGSWDIENKWTGPYANSHSNMTEIQDALDLLWRNNISPKKVTFGMAFYARSFTLENPACNTLGCRVSSGGNAGKCSGTTGVLLHPEIADEVRTRGLTPTLHREAAVKSVSWGDQWVTFDDAATWRLKANMIRGQCIPGVMVWAMSQDDKDGTNIKALTSAVGRKQMNLPNFNPNPDPMLNLPQPAKLCRWSGCYRECPAGFKVMLRDGYGGELMGSGEHCMDGGFSKLCCPEDQDMPKCSWRGHRNSGNCQPGCEPGEVEIGTLGIGCSSNHQTACCTHTPSTWAYGECRWTDCGEACPGERPHKVVSAWQGFGGQRNCAIDKMRDYCCKSPPPADFTDCAWSLRGDPPHVTRDDLREFFCDDSCPGDQVKLATETSGGFTGFGNECFAGAKAYCCKEPKVALVPRDEPTDGGRSNEEFRLLLEAYMANPMCPATELDPTPSPGNTFIMRRSLVVEAARYAELHGRATSCDELKFQKQITFAALLLTGADLMLGPLTALYDTLFAAFYDVQLLMANLREYYRSLPELDPNSLMRYVFLNPRVAGQGIRRDREQAELFCEEPVRRRKRGAGDVGHPEPSALSPRYVYWGPSEIPGIPDSNIVLQAIQDGRLSLHYARWQYINGGNFAEGPMLEMAFWIGRQPGVSTINDPSFNDLRDTDAPDNGSPDRWVVMHFHINPETEWLRVHNGHTHVGIQSIGIFHGYEIDAPRYRNGGDWRVNGWYSQNGGRNRRQQNGAFRCRDNDLWYPGIPVTVPNNLNTAYFNRFQAFGNYLFNSGYLSSTSVDLILNAPHRLGNGDVDPRDFEDIEFVQEEHAGWGIGPWVVNFRVDSTLTTSTRPFVFNIPEPPN